MAMRQEAIMVEIKSTHNYIMTLVISTWIYVHDDTPVKWCLIFVLEVAFWCLSIKLHSGKQQRSFIPSSKTISNEQQTKLPGLNETQSTAVSDLYIFRLSKHGAPTLILQNQSSKIRESCIKGNRGKLRNCLHISASCHLVPTTVSEHGKNAWDQVCEDYPFNILSFLMGQNMLWNPFNIWYKWYNTSNHSQSGWEHYVSHLFDLWS